MYIGIIGLGSMGQMLVKGFCKSGAVTPGQLVVFNRTRGKAERLRQEYPFAIASTAQEVCQRADIVFICTKPLDVLPLLRTLALPAETHLVSVAAGVTLADLEAVHAGPVSKVIPTVTSQELRGVSLYACGRRVTPSLRADLLRLLTALGKAEEVSEESIETATILTSSAPGLLAGILDAFARAAVRQSPELELDTARRILAETLMGTALLLENERLDFHRLIERVATKGGITEEGLRVLDSTLPAVFDDLFAVTKAKHALLKERLQPLSCNEKGDR
jgi:pyrroline-5-carboxylate reductase